MKKIAVIGSPGAGKTYFSKQLASRLKIPLHHLDYYYYDSNFNYPEDRQAWRRKVIELANQPRWIIDGNYKSTFDIRFAQADTIIFLDYPRNVTMRRAIKRRAVLNGKIRDDMPSNWREKFTLGLLKTIWMYNKVQRPKIYALLEAQEDKNIFIFHSSEQTDEYLHGLRGSYRPPTTAKPR